MSTTSSVSATTLASTSSLTNLSSTWTTLIDQELSSEEKQRLDPLTAQSTALDTKQAIITDLGTQITNLKNTLGALWSTNSAYVANSARSASVSDKTITSVSTSSGSAVSTTSSASSSTILTASADTTAALGTYEVSVTSLAQAQRISSTTTYTSSTKALGTSYAGTFNMKVGGSSTNITVTGDDTLYTLASKINSAVYSSGSGVAATVVNNTLILQSQSTGTDYQMTLSDTSGSALHNLGLINSSGDIAKTLTSASNAVFSVNGISVTRNSNSGITDVINGVTLNLASDAVGANATLTIQSDASAVESAISSFISQYNSLQTYLANKTGLTQVSDTQYNQGDLTDDANVRALKSGLMDNFLMDSTGSSIGSITNFNELGLTMNNNQLSISDSTTLEDAIKNSSADVKTFLDSKMSSLNNLLGTYVGSDYSYVDYSITAIKNQKTLLNSEITSETAQLTSKQKELIDYYQTISDTLTQISNSSTTMTAWLKAVYGTSSST